MISLSTFTDPFYTETVPLDGRPYILTFKYSQREDRWYMDVTDVDSTLDIVLGIKIVPNFDLLGRFRYMPNCPQGALIATINDGNDDSAPGQNELGIASRVTLNYITQTERLAIAAGTFVAPT